MMMLLEEAPNKNHNNVHNPKSSKTLTTRTPYVTKWLSQQDSNFVTILIHQLITMKILKTDAFKKKF